MTRLLFKRAIQILAGTACLCLAGFGQTVRPVINELGDPGKGRVEYVNDGLTPLNVVLEAKSFAVSETGEVTYRPLDPDIHLKLSTTSFRIQPQQTYYVFYEATAPKSPNWFVIYASFSGFNFRTAQGMNVRLQLPHTVYLLPKTSVERADLVVVEVENQGDNFGRVLETNLIYDRKKKQEAPGFPVFPHSKRRMEIPLNDKAEGENVPVEVSLQLDKFKLEEKLLRVNAPEPVTAAVIAEPNPSNTTSSTQEASPKDKNP